MAGSMPRRRDCCYGEGMTPIGRASASVVRAEPLLAPGVRSITILGATGSIGASTVDLIKRHPDRYRVEAVTARRNAAALAKLARELGARYAAVGEPSAYQELKSALSGSGIEV